MSIRQILAFDQSQEDTSLLAWFEVSWTRRNQGQTVNT